MFNIGGGSRVSVNDALELLERFAGRSLDVVRLDAQHGDVRDTGADIAAARAKLSFAPATSFADGLLAEWNWARAATESPTGRRRLAGM